MAKALANNGAPRPALPAGLLAAAMTHDDMYLENRAKQPVERVEDIVETVSSGIIFERSEKRTIGAAHCTGHRTDG